MLLYPVHKRCKYIISYKIFQFDESFYKICAVRTNTVEIEQRKKYVEDRWWRVHIKKYALLIIYGNYKVYIILI